MAGPTVVVSVLASVKGFVDSLSSVGSSAQSAMSKAHDAFGGFLAAVNKTGVLGPFGAALDGIDQAIGVIAQHGKDVGPLLMGVGGAMAGIGVALQAVGSKEKAANQQLQASIQATGKDYDDYSDQIEATIKAHEKYGDSAADTMNALNKLTEATHDPQKALDLLGTTTDVAAAKHEDLVTAAGQIAKVYSGSTRLLKEFGIAIDKNTGKTADGKTALEALADVTKGQASASIDTFSGKLDALKAKLEDTLSSIGTKYGPAITTIGIALTGLGSLWTMVSAIMAADWAIAFWPVAAVIAAIALVGVAIYELWHHFNVATVAIAFLLLGPFIPLVVIVAKNFDNIKRIINDFIGWLSTAWGAVTGFFVDLWDGIVKGFQTAWQAVYDFLAPIVTKVIEAFTFIGQVLFAIAQVLAIPWEIAFAYIQALAELVARLIVAAWNWLAGVLNGIANILAGPFDAAFNFIAGVANLVVNGIVAAWNWLVGVLGGIVATIGRIVSGPWHAALDAVGMVTDGISKAWNGLYDTLAGVVNKVKGIFGGMWSGITEAFRGAINGVIDIWNSLHFPSFHLPGTSVDIGGVGLPHIDHLASGGIVNQPTLALIGEAGPEAVVPLSNRNLGGPAVVIHNANFNDAADVDLLMAKAEFAVSAGRF